MGRCFKFNHLLVIHVWYIKSNCTCDLCPTDLICFSFSRKENLINEERLKIIRELSKKPDIYERLARAIGKNFIIIEPGMSLNTTANLKWLNLTHFLCSSKYLWKWGHQKRNTSSVVWRLQERFLTFRSRKIQVNFKKLKWSGKLQMILCCWDLSSL